MLHDQSRTDHGMFFSLYQLMQRERTRDVDIPSCTRVNSHSMDEIHAVRWPMQGGTVTSHLKERLVNMSLPLVDYLFTSIP